MAMAMASARSGSELVKTFLETMEARDLAGARAMLAPGFAMTFPSGARFATLEELVAWARPRYQWVRKRYDRFDEVPGAGGESVVYCHGTLHGVWPDGTAFEGIRFIDRFAIVGPPERCVERLRELRSLGFDKVAISGAMRGVSEEDAAISRKLVAEAMIPAMKRR